MTHFKCIVEICIIIIIIIIVIVIIIIIVVFVVVSAAVSFYYDICVLGSRTTSITAIIRQMKQMIFPAFKKFLTKKISQAQPKRFFPSTYLVHLIIISVCTSFVHRVYVCLYV